MHDNLILEWKNGLTEENWTYKVGFLLELYDVYIYKPLNHSIIYDEIFQGWGNVVLLFYLSPYNYVTGGWCFLDEG